MLMQAAGVAVGVAQGDPLNFKITTKEDFEMAEALQEKRKSTQRRGMHKKAGSSTVRRVTGRPR